MTKKWILLLAGCALMACNPKTVDFSYTPAQPKAGESVAFTNLSSNGEEWEWNFGDATSSITKNPTKVYRQPGKYIVTLKVDKKSTMTKSKEIIVYDTIPNFNCSVSGADSLGLSIYEPVTFTAQVYNPFNYPVTYEWSVLSGATCPISISNTASSWTIYFQRASEADSVQLIVTLNGESFTTIRSYTIHDVAASAVLMQTADGKKFRPRIYGIHAEERQTINYPEGIQILEETQDTFQIYNDHWYYLSELQTEIPTLLGFKLVSRKIYARTLEGLCVANLPEAENLVVVDASVPQALTTDVVNNRFYWANEHGVWYMPLINSQNNKYTSQPIQLDTLSNVVKLAIDTQAR